MKLYSGLTSDTANNLLLDSGAFFKNFDITTDTFESAKTAGKLIGATQGGGEFSANPTIRQVAVDGVRGKAKGLERFDEWVVSIKANVLEATKDAFKMALVSVKETTVTGPSGVTYTKLTPNEEIAIADYINNITWVGTISGKSAPVIIQVYDAINADGLTLTFADKSEGKVALNFSGHYDYTGDDQEPPFDIFYPNQSTSTSQSSGTSGTTQSGTQ